MSLNGCMVVYRGDRAVYPWKGVAFDRGVPTWVRHESSIAGDTELDDWHPGDEADTGRPITVELPRDPMFLLAVPAVVAAIRARFPTCPIVINGQPLSSAFAGAWTGVSAGGRAVDQPYRRFNLAGSRKGIFFGMSSVAAHAVGLQAVRAMGMDGGEVIESLPPAGRGTHVVLVRPRRGMSPELRAEVLARFAGVDLREVMDYQQDVPQADMVRTAAAVVVIGRSPLVWVARLGGTPLVYLADRPMTVGESRQMGEGATVATLARVAEASPKSVADSILTALETDHGYIPDRTGRTESPRGVPGAEAGRGRRSRHQPSPDPVPDPDAGGETADPDPVS